MNNPEAITLLTYIMGGVILILLVLAVLVAKRGKGNNQAK
jgi:Na+-transporting methylmalonyl-CoA/oxaloacetate decarboxylase gamma subunit